MVLGRVIPEVATNFEEGTPFGAELLNHTHT
jgi:hypothetical protein